MKLIVASLLVLIAVAPLARAQYTFGTEVSSNPGSANESYNSGTKTFIYTDTNTSGDDDAYVPLTGSGANFISLTNSWTASLTMNLASATMSKGTNASPQFGGSLALISTSASGTSFASMTLGQNNNTGDSGNSDIPTNFFGTLAEFEVDDSNGNPQNTTTLGSASNYQGSSYLEVAGGTSSTPATETINAATGTLTLSFNAANDTLTGSLNGSAIGSFNLSVLPAGSTVQLVVAGSSGEGEAVSGTMDTASSFVVAPEPSTCLLLVLGFAGLMGWSLLPRARACSSS